MIELLTLGSLNLRDQNGRDMRPILAQPKRLALLVYLTLANSRGFRRRDTVVGLFWPELDQEHARGALRQALRFLRRTLGAGVVVARGEEEIGVDSSALWCDAVAFEHACRGGDARQALDLYHDDFLSGFFVSGAAPELDQWMEEERARLRRHAGEAAWALADRPGERGEGMAATWGRRAAALTPNDEGELRRLLALLDRLGDRAGALAAYEEFARRLNGEFAAEPAPETQSLIQSIRSRVGSRFLTAGDVAEPPLSPVRRGTEQSGSVPAETVLSEQPHRRRMLVLLAVGGVVAIGGYLAAFSRQSDQAPELEADLVAVAPFDVLDSTLALWHEGMVDYLSRNLDGAGTLRSVSPTVVIRHWKGRADLSSAAELGRRTGARLVFFGQLVAAGSDSAKARATLFDVGKGTVVAEFERPDVAGRVDRIADSLTLDILRSFEPGRPAGRVRLASVGTSSILALKEFLRGEQDYRRTNWDSALAHYHRAVMVDSTFALALRRLYLVLGWNSAASANYEDASRYNVRATAHNHGLAPRDSLLIYLDSLQSQSYDSSFADQYRHLFVTIEGALRRYPGDPEVWQVAGEERYHFGIPPLGTVRTALEAFDRAIALDSDFAPGYVHAVQLALRAHDPDRARGYAEAYLSLKPTDVSATGIRADAMFMNPHSPKRELDRLIDTASAVALWNAAFDLLHWPDSGEASVRLLRGLRFRPPCGHDGAPSFVDDSVVQGQVLAAMLAFRGHLKEAAGLSLQSATQEMMSPGPTMNHEWDPLLDLALLGAVSPDTVETILRFHSFRDSLYGEWPRKALAWWQTRADATALLRFIAHADSASRQGGATTRLQAGYAGELARGYLMLARGDSGAALTKLAGIPDQMCILASCFYQKLTQGRLLAAVGRRDAAAAIFDNWLGTRDLSPLYVAAFLQRAHMAERAGDEAEARRSYRFVADIWRHADLELQPYVAEAKAATARLAGRRGGMAR